MSTKSGIIKWICSCCSNKLQNGKASNKNWICSSARYQKDSVCKLIRVEEKELERLTIKSMYATVDITVDAQRILALSLDKQSTYEIMKAMSEKKICGMMDFLIEQGYLESVGVKYPFRVWELQN